MPDTYRISELDPETDEWEPQHTGLTLWEVRAVLRKWYGGTAAFGMSHLQVKAETHEREARRFKSMAPVWLPSRIRRERRQSAAMRRQRQTKLFS